MAKGKPLSDSEQAVVDRIKSKEARARVAAFIEGMNIAVGSYDPRPKYVNGGQLDFPAHGGSRRRQGYSSIQGDLEK